MFFFLWNITELAILKFFKDLMVSTNAHPQPPLPKMSKLFIESVPISSTPLPTLKIFYPNWDIDISRSMFKAHQISCIKAESVSYQPRVKFCYKYLFSKGKNAHNLLSQGIKRVLHLLWCYSQPPPCHLLPVPNKFKQISGLPSEKKAYWTIQIPMESVPWGTEFYSHSTSQTS